MIPLPLLHTGSKYYSCCGKTACSGCIFAPVYDNLGNIIGKGGQKCPFCRTLVSTSHKEDIRRLKKRVEVGDANAMHGLGSCYHYGSYGLPQDRTMALEFWHKAGELGDAKAYSNFGSIYYNGNGVVRDEKKAKYYYELAAMGGLSEARHNLGNGEVRAGNWDRAIKHYMIAAGGGGNDSVKMIQKLYMNRHATKEDYANALRAHQKYLGEIWSEQRDKAAAFSEEEYKYY